MQAVHVLVELIVSVVYLHEQDAGASIPPLRPWSKIPPAAAPRFPPIPHPSAVLSLCTSFRGMNPLIPSRPCKQGSSGFCPGKFFEI